MEVDKRKTVPLFNSAFNEFLDELKELNSEGRLKDFICIYSNSVKEKDKKEGEVNLEVHDYWFGETNVVFCLGLLEVMKERIHEYKREEGVDD